MKPLRKKKKKKHTGGVGGGVVMWTHKHGGGGEGGTGNIINICVTPVSYKSRREILCLCRMDILYINF